MPETTTERLAALIGLVAAISLMLVALSAQTQGNTVPAAARVPVDGVPAASVPQQPDESVVAAARPPAAPKSPPSSTVLLALTAARGDCWLSVRAGTPEGKVLYEGTLASGRTIRLEGARLWVRFGAAANLDLTLNGKKVAALPAGTVDVVATPAGVRAAGTA
jgi:hypothetical protein